MLQRSNETTKVGGDEGSVRANAPLRVVRQ